MRLSRQVRGWPVTAVALGVGGLAAVAVVGGGIVLAGGGGTPAAAAGVALGRAGTCPGGTPTVTAQGEGTAEGPPDLLTITLGVQTSAASASGALSQNSAAANAVVAKLEADGVAAADLQTSGLSIQPVYARNNSVITSYQVTNTVTVKLRNLSNAGAVIDDAAQAAGNAIQVDGIAFSIQNDSALQSQARQAAVQQATGFARAMAAGAGARLGSLCSLTDDTSPPSPLTFAAAGSPAAGSTPIESGTQQITADVTVVYRLAG